MIKPLRILMICPQFRPLVGGYERAAERLSLGLASMGHVVHVATERRRSEWPRLESEAGLEIHRLWCIPKKGLHLLSGLASLCGFLLRRGRFYDVFHVHQYGWTAAAAVCLGHLLARPVVLKLTNTGPNGIAAALPSGLAGQLSRFLHRHISACVVTSERARDEAIAFGIPSARIHLIPNPLDTGRFHPLESAERERNRERLGVAGGFLAISVSRLTSQKNHRMLLDAWSRLPSNAEGFALAILGDGPLRSEIEGLARQSPAAATIRVLGNVADPLQWYQAADLFLLSSSHEGLSNSLMEALGCGVPVVSTRVSGSEDILARTEVGQLVNLGDAQAMALAIQRFREDPVWRGQCSQAARRHAVEHYSLPGVSQAISALYRSLVDADGRRSIAMSH